MTAAIQRVVKLGGSLLELPDLALRLRGWLARQAPMPTLLVVGGGRLADVVRDYDRLYHLGDEAAHWLAVQTMSLHASLLSALLPEAKLQSSFSASVPTEDRLLIFDPEKFLRHEEPRLAGKPLARHWGVTSDSIAARLASVCQAHELVLLKSALPSAPGDLAMAAARGYVDGCFAQASRGLPRIRCVNFRDEGFAEGVLAAPEPVVR
jgi:5-(aminomethyl)-3-furanmethanol phosphate kinase